MIAAALVAVTCGHSSPTERGRLCRRYPTAMTVNGSGRDCRLDGRTFACSRGWYQSWGWSYGSAWDFVLEARAPHLRLMRRQTYSWQGHWAWMGSGGSETEYQYQGGGQLATRRRTSSWSSGTSGMMERRELDRTEYDSWDDVGRPIAGTYWVGEQTTPFSIVYEDATRTMRSSIGELAVQDEDGNLVREVEVIGGSTMASEYAIQATAEVCIEP